MPERASEISGIGQPLTEKVDIAAMNGPGNDPASWSGIRKDIGYKHIRSHYRDRPKGALMRATPDFTASWRRDRPPGRPASSVFQEQWTDATGFAKNKAGEFIKRFLGDGLRGQHVPQHAEVIDIASSQQ